MRSYIGVFWLLATLFTPLGLVNAAALTTSDKPGFIKAAGRKFTLDGKPFRYIGTNAYWLQLLNKEDLNKTMHDISAIGVKVVRTWAFNDVTEIPKDGVWLQVFHENGTIEINMGENGLLRLDNIVQAAKDNKLHVAFALTNNWFRGATGSGKHKHKHKNSKRGNYTTTPVDRPRNTLSNDYGGMDVYNKHFRNRHKKDSDIFHDDFYTNDAIVDAYSRYVATIVKRYAQEPSVLGWELANDPRCSSGLPASESCTPQTITKWTATIAAVVKENDPNHLVSVGDGGFFCVGCPKLFPRKHPHEAKPPHETKPPYETEPPHETKPPYETKPLYETKPPYDTCQEEPCQKEDRQHGYLTEVDLRKLFAKRAKRRLSARGSQDKSRHCKTRGHGYAARGEDHKYSDHKSPDHKNQSHTFGPIFDGSFGIDAEDLANAPGIDFTTLQYYPDQTTFGPEGDIDLDDPCNIAQNGVDWVKLHAKTGKTFGKPVTVTAFGVLTDESRRKFVPFNPNDEENDFATCTTVDDRADIFDAVFGAGIKAGVNVQQYQWGQRNLTSFPHRSIRRQDPEEQSTVGTSPNDGYAEYDYDPGRGSIAGAAYDMDAGDADDDYEGGDSYDDYEGGDTDDGGGEDDG